jgi:hypothetical protein
MFEAFSRSWEITKLSIEVIKKDKELLMFPILSGIFSVLFIIAILFPAIIGPLVLGIAGGEAATTVGIYLSLFIVYFGLSIIATFFNVCTVYTIKKRFDGGNATFGESVKFGFSRFGLIVKWGLISATVGLILRIIEDAAERVGGLTEIIIKIITSLLGAAWSVITIFVVPSMVYKNLGPKDAIKSSVATLKKTWGESLIREFGIGAVSFVFFLIGIIFWLAILFLLMPLGAVAIAFVALFAVIYFIAVIVFFSLVNSVFNTALYVYAEKGKVPAFKPEILKGAFRARKN